MRRAIGITLAPLIVAMGFALFVVQTIAHNVERLSSWLIGRLGAAMFFFIPREHREHEAVKRALAAYRQKRGEP